MKLGNAIRDIRKQRGLSQIQIASEAGITQTYLSLIEGDKKEPNLSTLKTISDSLGVPVPILFFLAMDEEDVAPKKRDAFKIISPSVKSLINEFFSVPKKRD